VVLEVEARGAWFGCLKETKWMGAEVSYEGIILKGYVIADRAGQPTYNAVATVIAVSTVIRETGLIMAI